MNPLHSLPGLVGLPILSGVSYYYREQEWASINLIILAFFIARENFRAMIRRYLKPKGGSTLVSWIHNLGVIYLCTKFLLANSRSFGAVCSPFLLKYIFRFSTAYFIYDMFNHDMFDMYSLHHIASILGLLHGTAEHADTYGCIMGFLFIELGNFPIYPVCLLCYHKNPELKKRYYKHWIKFQFFMAFVFKTCGVVAVTLLKGTKWQSFLTCAALQAINIPWLMGLYRKIKNEPIS